MTLREEEARSIRAFVQLAADEGHLSGNVLDYGCGQQPYRDIVETAGGEYAPYDRVDFPGSVASQDYGAAGVVGDWGGEERDDSPLWTDWDAILCTQVIQYHRYPDAMLNDMRGALQEAHGHVVLTYPTNWPEVEPVDLWRFTKFGMTTLLEAAGFEIIRHDWRHGFRHEGISFTVGYGVIARA